MKAGAAKKYSLLHFQICRSSKVRARGQNELEYFLNAYYPRKQKAVAK